MQLFVQHARAVRPDVEMSGAKMRQRLSTSAAASTACLRPSNLPRLVSGYSILCCVFSAMSNGHFSVRHQPKSAFASSEIGVRFRPKYTPMLLPGHMEPPLPLLAVC